MYQGEKKIGKFDGRLSGNAVSFKSPKMTLLAV